MGKSRLISQKELIKSLGVTPQIFRSYVRQKNIDVFLINKTLYYKKSDFKLKLLGDNYISINRLVKMNQHISKQRIHKLILDNKIKKYRMLDNFDKNIYVKKSQLQNIKQFN